MTGVATCDSAWIANTLVRSLTSGMVGYLAVQPAFEPASHSAHVPAQSGETARTGECPSAAHGERRAATGCDARDGRARRSTALASGQRSAHHGEMTSWFHASSSPASLGWI